MKTATLWIAAAWMMIVPLSRGDDWPQWRGPNRDAHAASNAPVPTSLPRELRPAWKLAIGTGHSSPIVVADKVIYLDEQNSQEVVHAIDAASGQELWSVPFAESYGDEWGSGPRSTPLADDIRVYAQSCRGDFVCLRLSDGGAVWRTSFEKKFGVKFYGSQANQGTAARRGNNGSGVIDQDRLVLPVGSTRGASLVCFNKQNGDILWQCGNDEAAYSSLIVAQLAGVQQVVAFTAEALLGARLTDGQILWRVPLKTAANRHAATPVIFGDTVTVNSHSLGLVCMQVSREGDGLKAERLWVNKSLKINIATPVLYRDSFFCQGPNKDFVCVNAATGELRWQQSGFGRGIKDYSSSFVVGDKLLVLSESGTLYLLDANSSEYSELSRLQVCGNTWSFPAYANGKLFVRDAASLACVNLFEDQSATH